MTNTLYNLARMTTTTTGTGTVSLLSAVSGYLSFEDAGVQDADVVTYAIHEGSNSEVGQGTYTSSGATLSRDVVYASTNNGAQITLSGNAQVFITAAAEDFASLVDASGTPADSQVAVWTDANTIEGASSLTYDGTTLTANGTIKLQETTAAAADTAGYGQIWVKNDSPSTLWYTDDAGTDYEIGTGAGGTVDVSGTPVNDQIAIWTDADTLEGQTALTFTSGVLQVGSGDSGATIDSGADNFQIKTSSTADIGMTISDGGSTSTHTIHLRASDDDWGFLYTDHDPVSSDYGTSIGYNDGSAYTSFRCAHDGQTHDFIVTNVIKAQFDDGSLFQAEQAAAQADQAGYGQIWIRSDTPCTPMFTDDAGTDYKIQVNQESGGYEQINVGVADDTPGIIRSYGGGATEDGGAIRAYNAADHDTDVDFWQVGPNNQDGTGDFAIMEYNGSTFTPRVTIDDDTGDVTVKQNLVVDGNIQGGIWTEHADNPKATTSGTAANWTSIPSWAKEIVISFVGVSTNGTSPWLIRLGDSGGVETTGYTARCRGNTSGTSDTTGFILTTSNHAAADLIYGEVRLSRVNNGLGWTYTSQCVGNANLFIGSGYKATSATTDRIQLTTTGGANTFDAGSVSVKYS